MAAARAKLQDSLDTDTYIIDLFPDDVLRHLSAQNRNQQTHTAILRQSDGVKTYIVAPIKESQCTDCGSKVVCH